jgi:HTH-type transcriptional regulator/antitoxin MqsA
MWRSGPGCRRVEAHQHGDAGIQPAGQRVDPGFITNVRKKLALDPREAGEIFGGGVNAFSRYENGRTKPPLALVKLLKVLDRHPDLLDEVRSA